MSYAQRVCWLSLCWWSAILPLRAAAADAPTARDVLLVSDAISEDDFAILEGALAKLNANLQRVPSPAPPCEPDAGPIAPGVRVWVTWQPAQIVSLCFEDRSGRHARVLGPFERLHGSAREQLMTVIESGLQAAEAAEAELAARETVPPPPAAAPAPAPPPPAAAPAEPRPWSVRPSLGVGLSSWSSRALATQLDAALGVSWRPRALDLRLELGLVPAFTVDGSSPNLALQAQSWRVGLALQKRFALYERLGGQLSGGLALEHVRVKPETHGVTLQARHTTAHGDPLLFLRAGPSFALGGQFMVSLSAGAELLLHPRRYGFTIGENTEAVLDLARLRASVLLEISTAL